jgi:hypothetical protein
MAGIAALMLEKFGSLGLCDIEFILRTSAKVFATSSQRALTSHGISGTITGDFALPCKV